MGRLLSVVVPCHNEAANLEVLHVEVVRACAEASLEQFELILVDDGSTDFTLDVARSLTSDPRVRVLAFSRNFGKEAAMLAGLRAAKGDAVIIMDADLQHPPALIPQLVAGWDEGNHQVVAVRDRTGDPWLRTVLSRGYYRLMGRMMDVRLQDGAGDFRLLSRRAVDAVLSLTEVNRFSKGLFSWIGMRTKEIQFQNRARERGSSSWGLLSLFNYGVSGILAFNDRLVRLAVQLGVVAVLAALGYVVYLILATLLHGIDTPGYVTTIATVVGMGGVQLVFLGVLGEYVGRIYAEVKKRPAYIIEEEIDGAA